MFKWLGIGWAVSALLLLGCDKPAADRITLYTSVDAPVAKKIIEQFEKQTGIKVILQTDTEATKTAGLAETLEAEKSNPRADVWWSNEIFHTIRLAEQNVLAEYSSPSASSIPARFKDPKNRFAATALRARVIVIPADSPSPITSIADLADPRLAGKVAMARPTAGTTRGHVAALYTLWGREKYTEYFTALKRNDIRLLGGNSVVAEYVGRGQLLAGLTDNDDVDAILREGGKVEMILPDQGPGQIGTLVIPCTVGLVSGCKNPDAGKKLVDYLLSKEVEQKLIDVKFARYSVHNPAAIKIMSVDYAKVSGNMKEAVELALTILEGR